MYIKQSSDPLSESFWRQTHCQFAGFVTDTLLQWCCLSGKWEWRITTLDMKPHTILQIQHEKGEGMDRNFKTYRRGFMGVVFFIAENNKHKSKFEM